MSDESPEELLAFLEGAACVKLMKEHGMEWELDLVPSLRDRMDTGRGLSPRQTAKLHQVAERVSKIVSGGRTDG